jgi:hypothetical protein
MRVAELDRDACVAGDASAMGDARVAADARVPARRLAPWLGSLLVVFPLGLVGCVVRDFDYEEPANVPPSVHSAVETPMSRVRMVALDAPIGADGGGSTALEFVAIVRDVDVQQPLEGLVYLDRNPDAPSRGSLIGELPVPPAGAPNPLERRVRFVVPLSELTRGCHAVELHVSGRFVGAVNPQPADPADLGVGVWWIAATDASQPAVDMTACPGYQ